MLPGESHRQRSLLDYSPWGRRESGTTERLNNRKKEKKKRKKKEKDKSTDTDIFDDIAIKEGKED